MITSSDEVNPAHSSMCSSGEKSEYDLLILRDKQNSLKHELVLFQGGACGENCA